MSQMKTLQHPPVTFVEALQQNLKETGETQSRLKSRADDSHSDSHRTLDTHQPVSLSVIASTEIIVFCFSVDPNNLIATGILMGPTF